eukprot:CAMPEP_0178905440 /NCGR_PEP_ID=MMETSP0786-20121207/6277_1 /TAXON_ID=186022 /ORGANISM="Thalassionema frauenfeldii, Strain CCMP 1798" /LENGTH=214 /DNA_ID=CAMNT_0020577049 /DNA_START=59 /DNA_END=703 /DNA_ORIENTATION=+
MRHQGSLQRDDSFSDAVIDVNEGFKKMFFSNSERAKTKSIFFRREVVKANTWSRHDYTMEERRSYWWNAAELAVIKQHNENMIKLFKQGILEEDSTEHCSRGLDHRISDVGRRTRRAKARKAVFETQRLYGNNSEEIANSYRKAAGSSCLRAYNRGVMDELESVKIYTEHVNNTKNKSATSRRDTEKNINSSRRGPFGRMSSLIRLGLATTMVK